MDLANQNIEPTPEQYWQKMDILFGIAERKNIIAAIKRTDTEKFYAFTRMIRITNTLNKVKVSTNK